MQRLCTTLFLVCVLATGLLGARPPVASAHSDRGGPAMRAHDGKDDSRARDDDDDGEDDGHKTRARGRRCARVSPSRRSDVRAAPIMGTSGDDRIIAGGGNNTVYALAGSDLVCGNAGYDTLFGGIGDDTLLGGVGSDTLLGDAGNDTLDGGDGNDSAHGGGGDDTLLGGPGKDRIDGGVGYDVCIGTLGVDAFVNCEVVQRQVAPTSAPPRGPGRRQADRHHHHKGTHDADR